MVFILQLLLAIQAIGDDFTNLPCEHSPNPGGFQIEYYSPVGQSFNATFDNLKGIAVYINNMNNLGNEDDTTLGLALYEGEGFDGELIYNNIFEIPDIPEITPENWNPSFWAYLNLDEPVPLIIGSMYTFSISADTPRWGISKNIRCSKDTDGDSYQFGAKSSGDLLFHISSNNIHDTTCNLGLDHWIQVSYYLTGPKDEYWINGYAPNCIFECCFLGWEILQDNHVDLRDYAWVQNNFNAID